MKLADYLDKENLSQREFLKLVLQKTDTYIPQGTISKYVLENRIPTKKNMVAIMDATEMQVQANDLYLDQS